jgi:YidC/Oxa1 family membrane protein insertase
MEKRWILFILVVFLITLFYSMLGRRPEETKAPEGQAVEQQAEVKEEPQAGETPAPPPRQEIIRVVEEPSEADFHAAQQIPVTTDFYHIVFTTLGARPISWEVIDPTYVSTTDNGTSAPIELVPQVENPAAREYPLEVDFREFNAGSFSDFNQMIFQYERSADSQGNTVLIFTSPILEGIRLKKAITIPEHGYLCDLRVTVENTTDARYRFDYDGKGLSISWGAGVGSIQSPQPGEQRYIKPIYKAKGKKPGDRMPRKDKPFEYSGAVEWAGLQTRFFLAAIVPVSDPSNALRSQIKYRNISEEYTNPENKLAAPVSIELFQDQFTLEPGETREYEYKVFVGPKEYNILNAADYDLSKVLFYTSFRWMRAVCIALLKILKYLDLLLHNYGLAIIALTFMARIVMHPLTHKGMKLQAKTMAEQQKIKPYLDEIMKKYKDNPQKRNQETMKLYKEHGINPFGMLRGCFPMLLQTPIFFALYRLLSQAIDLRQQGFLWIKDLSGPDALVKFDFNIPFLGPYLNILPIIMGASQYLVSRFSTTNIKDPTQRQMLIMMPLFFTFILYNLPSGLVLYWLVSNMWQTAHQLIANKLIKKEQAA